MSVQILFYFTNMIIFVTESSAVETGGVGWWGWEPVQVTLPDYVSFIFVFLDGNIICRYTS
jgi:hypothetical protein